MASNSVSSSTQASRQQAIVVTIAGVDSAEVLAALGRYLVGVLPGAIKIDAQLSQDILAEGVDRRQEIHRAVESLIGRHNTFTTKKEILFRDTRRNAWMGGGYRSRTAGT